MNNKTIIDLNDVLFNLRYLYINISQNHLKDLVICTLAIKAEEVIELAQQMVYGIAYETSDNLERLVMRYKKAYPNEDIVRLVSIVYTNTPDLNIEVPHPSASAKFEIKKDLLRITLS